MSFSSFSFQYCPHIFRILIQSRAHDVFTFGTQPTNRFQIQFLRLPTERTLAARAQSRNGRRSVFIHSLIRDYIKFRQNFFSGHSLLQLVPIYELTHMVNVIKIFLTRRFGFLASVVTTPIYTQVLYTFQWNRLTV